MGWSPFRKVVAPSTITALTTKTATISAEDALPPLPWEPNAGHSQTLTAEIRDAPPRRHVTAAAALTGVSGYLQTLGISLPG